MQFAGDLRTLLGYRDFRRLFAVRLTSQFSDGVFQAALASFVLFSPEHQPTAGAIAGTFAILLLPFSVLGPFCGVFLDRWSRRQVLLWSNAVRAVLLVPIASLIAGGADGPLVYALGLACFSVNRFLLAGLSASLPHVVPGDRLVMANAISPTCGTLAVLLGLTLGSGISRLAAGAFLHPETVLVILGAVGYLAASYLATRMSRDLLGPDLDEARPAVRDAVGHVFRGLADGARHVVDRKPALHALAVIGAHRFFYGVSTIATLMLFRNYFHPGDASAALGGMAVIVVASGLGYALAALLTPMVVDRAAGDGRPAIQRWMVSLLIAAAVVQVIPGMLFTAPALFVGAFVLGIASQGIKICVDTLIQENVEDVYRGRVFSIFDVLFNVVFVAAAAFAAVSLPPNGKSYVVLGVVAIGYLLTAFLYARATVPAPLRTLRTVHSR